jgi:transaldolase/glucose-6-phosphate isomerase
MKSIAVSDSMKLSPTLLEAFNSALQKCEKDNVVFRLWAKDASLFTNSGEEKMLEWLNEPARMLNEIDKVQAVARALWARGFCEVVLLGMGGSSLAPQVFHELLAPSAPFRVLESTHPAAIARVQGAINLAGTLFIVSSKSGHTLEPKILFEYFWSELTKAKVADPLSHFTSITDPISPLEQLASEHGFLPGMFGNPGIGGRFSALSPFGILPAAMMGIDLKRLLKSALSMSDLCGPAMMPEENPGLMLALFLFINASCNKNHLRIYCSKSLLPFAHWLEQLVAESLGKDGKGIVPIISDEVSDNPGAAHLFLTAPGDEAQHAAWILALQKTEASVVSSTLADPYEIGAEIFRWQVAVSLAGAFWSINPFDQPDVESSKELTRQTLVKWQNNPKFMEYEPDTATEHLELFFGANQTSNCLKDFFGAIKPDEYCGILSFIDDSPEIMERLKDLSTAIRQVWGVDCLVQVGPKYLHSTGQLFKGGDSSGHFLVLTSEYPHDIISTMPGLTFGNIHLSQAIGDFLSLEAKARSVVRVYMSEIYLGLKELSDLVNSKQGTRLGGGQK